MRIIGYMNVCNFNNEKEVISMAKNKNLIEKVNLCITPEDRQKLCELTEAKNTDASKLVRKLIRDEHEKFLQRKEDKIT